MRGQRERVTLANELTGPCAVPRRNFTTRAGVEVVVRLAPRHVATPSSREERRRSEQHLRTNRQNLWARLVSGAKGGQVLVRGMDGL